jgi:hypothetical protein
VGSQRLIAWAIAQPIFDFNLHILNFHHHNIMKILWKENWNNTYKYSGQKYQGNWLEILERIPGKPPRIFKLLYQYEHLVKNARNARRKYGRSRNIVFKTLLMSFYKYCWKHLVASSSSVRLCDTTRLPLDNIPSQILRGSYTKICRYNRILPRRRQSLIEYWFIIGQNSEHFT